MGKRLPRGRQAGGRAARPEGGSVEGGRAGQTRINQPLLPLRDRVEWSLNAPKEKSSWPDRRKTIEKDLRTDDARPPARARPLPLSNIQLIVSPYKTHNLSFLDIVQRRKTNG